MDKQLRLYVTRGKTTWRIYTIVISAKDGSFYCIIPSKLKSLIGKFSYHPSGAIHFKTPEGRKKYRKCGWPTFAKLTICPIDSFGFPIEAFLANGLLFQELQQEKIKEPALVFDIGSIRNALILRIYLGKREIVQDRTRLIEAIALGVPADSDAPDEKLMDLQTHSFGITKTDLGDFDLACGVALIQTSKL
jgi:hypothetical protein